MDVTDSYDGGSDIPDFIKLDQIPANYSQRAETDLLEPVVFQQGAGTTGDGFARFTLQNKGFLHSHSKIFMALAPQTAGTSYFFAPTVGIGQVVKKAVLKIGNKTINEVDSWRHLHAVKSSLITNENNKERESYLTGRWLAHSFVYDDKSRVVASKYGLDNGLEYLGDELNTPSWAIMDANALTECPSYSIDLSDLFPFLKIHQLPLYLMKEVVTIELTFVPPKRARAQKISGTADSEVHIVRDELKFCADYVFYNESGDEMARYAEANKDMSFSFVDYRVSENTISSTALASGVIRNIGMANRLVPRVITLLNDSGADETNILNDMVSIGPHKSASGVSGPVKFNVRYNDRFEFTSDIDNNARLFSMTTHSEGVPPFISREEFAGEANIISTKTYEGVAQSGALGGKFFNLSTRLSNGRVGQRGLEVHVSGNFPAGFPDLLRCYSEFIRVARLNMGYVEVYNS